MTTNTSSTVLTDAERRTLLIRANHPGIEGCRREYLIAITESAVLEKLRRNGSYMSHKSAFCLTYRPPK
ncbi:Uncharacterised protein [Bordetella trematum]|uniref:Uncharacterized protein n=1 Tax=Bordetella trematum TaxID=123899 RepID=A0A157KXC1_9BORD|nr:Uncharacterised protein [Bordetella trematum]SAI66585.1 Uncharacterised protein [Bordetella trematum]SUV96537.1 Uncharacterised protein [Bordetella trematum]